jgi:O-methyltransferase involved in polyketide biosynthesis
MSDLTESEQRRLLSRVDWLFARGNSFFRQRGETADGTIVNWPLSDSDGSTNFTPPAGTVAARCADVLDIKYQNAKIAALTAMVDGLAKASGQQIDVEGLMKRVDQQINDTLNARIVEAPIALSVTEPPK